jgi:hypothetical protein
MLSLLTGKTGSGKSYFAVSQIVDKLKEGRTVYTNIKLNVEYENYIYLDELGVKTFLVYIGNTFKEVDNLEQKKHEVQQTQYFESDFFIDEAHLVGFRDKKEAVLNWLTIHRHFNQNITVITQVPTNVHRDYLNMFHGHIDMIPQNKRLSKNSMGYREYDAYKGDRINTKYFKPDLSIFEIYNSGNVEKGVNQDIAKLYMIGGGLAVMAIVLYNLASGFMDRRTLKDDSNETQIHLVEKEEPSIIDTIGKDEYSLMCSTVNGCNFEGGIHTLNSFKIFIASRFHITDETLISISYPSRERIVRLTLVEK